MTGCLSKTSTTVSYNDRNNWKQWIHESSWGAAWGVINRHIDSAQSPWRFKKNALWSWPGSSKNILPKTEKWRRNTKRYLLLNYSIIFRSWCKNGAVLKLEHEKGKFWIRGRFSNVLIVTGPGKLLPFTFKMEVSIVLQITWWNYRLKKQMDRFVGKDSCLHSLDFGLNVWFRGRNVIGTFNKQAKGLLQHCFFVFPS